MGTGTVDTYSPAGRRFSRTRMLASSGIVGATALAAVFAGSTGNAQAAPSFTNPTFNMNIGKAGGAFVYPFGMAWDPTVSDSTGTEPGSLLVDDYNNYDVKRFGSDGAYMSTYGSKGTKTGQFSEQPSEIAVNPNDGSYVVAFAFNGYGYMKFASNGTFQYKVTNPVAYYAPFIAVNPQPPAAAASGEVYLVQSTGLSKSSPNIVLRFQGSNGALLGQFGTNGTNCSKGQFGVIRGIDVDNNGNVFVNDVSNHCIQVFSSTGVFEGYFGNKTELSANTRGMKLDRTNDVVYVADAAKEDVAAFNFTYTATQTVTTGTFAGYIGTSELSQGGTCSGNGVLDAPRDIAVGPDGTVYVSDYACWSIDVFHPLFDTTDGPGVWVNQFPDPSVPAPLGSLNGANGVAVSPDGTTVYVADTFNQRIQEFNGPTSTTGTPGTAIQQWGSRLPNLDGSFSMDYPRGVAVDPTDGSVWVSDTRSGYIKQYTTTNSPASVNFDQDFGGEGLSPGQFFYSDGITAAAGPVGDLLDFANPTTLYIPDSGIGYFQVMQDTTALGQPGYHTVAEFPCGILVEPDVFNGCTGSAVDSFGNIYAADFNDGVVDEFTYTIDPTTTLPTYSLALQISLPTGKLGGPYGVAISGNTLYVTQSTKNSVSAFDITTPATPAYLGSWGTKGTANGQLNRPLGIATDAAGNVYVDDYGNGRISVFTPAS